MKTLNPYLAPILKELEHYLDSFPKTNEHQIIKYLQKTNTPPFNELSLSQSKDLFSAHFLCMHALYQLKKRLAHEKQFTLIIHSVRVEKIKIDEHLTFIKPNNTFLAENDPLEAYYLNPKHYFETQEDDINAMLNSFWNKYLSQDKKIEALETLNLPLEADAQMIKAQYRRLAQKHHPDKGGCAVQFNRIQEAKTILDKAK